MNIRLSDHFTLHDMLRTTRDVDGDPSTPFWEDNAATDNEILQLKLLCKDVEAIWDHWGPLYVSSGFRSKELNRLVGGEKLSAHIYGCAADLIPMGKGATVEKIWRWLLRSGLRYDQAIWEVSKKGTHWLHYGIARPGFGPPRGMHFTIDMR